MNQSHQTHRWYFSQYFTDLILTLSLRLLPIPGMGGAQAPPPGVIQVTPEEKAAIERVSFFFVKIKSIY